MDPDQIDTAPTQSMDQLQLLQHFLQENFHANVLIPCVVGQKFPLFSYAQSTWTWSDYQSFLLTSSERCCEKNHPLNTFNTDIPGYECNQCATIQASDVAMHGCEECDYHLCNSCLLFKEKEKEKATVDWALVLKDICVIDVDHMDVATELEARFPILLQSPTVQTKKGSHYYFKRSQLTKTGYFDQQGFKNKIDFKTITPTGTGGLIMVPPSSDKKWIRSIWDTEMIEIPLDLLMHVAEPTTLPTPNAAETSTPAATTSTTSTTPSNEIQICLQFEQQEADATTMLVQGKRLQLLMDTDYFSTLLSGRWSNDTTTTSTTTSSSSSSSTETDVPVLKMPCSRTVCEEIFSILETEQWTNNTPPTIGILQQVDKTMDMLGFSYHKNPLLLRSSFFADLFNISPTWWRVHRDELRRTLGNSSEDSDNSLVFIDDELALCVGYEPIVKDERWLFPNLPTYLSVKNAKVFQDNPEKNVTEQMPPVVLAILQRYPQNVCAAGGAIVGAVSKFAKPGTDVDLFVHSLQQNESSTLLGAIEKFVDNKYKDEYIVSTTNAAVTFTPTHQERRSLLHRPFQIVLGLHRCRAQVLEYFDFAPTKVLARMDVESNTIIVEGLPSFVLALTNMSFIVDIKFWSPSSVTRITKYVAKGFECCIPGLKRAAFHKVLTTNADHFARDGVGPDSYKFASAASGWGHRKWKGIKTAGMGVLFVAESEVTRSRQCSFAEEFENIDRISGRLQPIEAAVIASKAAGMLRSGKRMSRRQKLRGYTHLSENTGTYNYIRESFRRNIEQRIADRRNGVPMHVKFFKFTDAGRFKPEDARMEEMYDADVLSGIASAEMYQRANAIVCAVCGLSQESLKRKESRRLMICSGSMICSGLRCSTPYCSRRCSKIGWKEGHKKVCSKGNASPAHKKSRKSKII